MLTAVSLFEALHDATREPHSRMEESIDVSRWMHSPDDYARLLARYLGVIEPIEDQLPRWPQLSTLGYRWQERRKAPAIRMDLEGLGITREQVATLPRCLGTPDLRSLGDVVGCLYVIEIGTLAGHAVAGIVKARNPMFPLRFYNVYGNETRNRWMEFLRFLHSFERIDGDCDEVIRGAIHTFHAFEEWMQEANIAESLRS
jgi:heme oxygenase